MSVLSKSNYLQFLKHPAWLWLEKHNKRMLPPIDDDTQALFDAGHAFEAYAEQLFPAGETLGYTVDGVFDFGLYRTLPERTMRAIRAGAPVLFQGRIEVDGLTCIFDVLERTVSGTYRLYEIKSSTSVKPEHEFDLAFQTHVLEQGGITIEQVFVVHVNREYVRNGAIDPAALTATVEVTDAVRALAPLTARKIEEAKRVMDMPHMPDPSPRHARLGSFAEWLKVYRTLTSDLPRYSVYDLTRVGAPEVGKWEDRDVRALVDIPVEDDMLSPRQRTQVAVTRSGVPQIDRGAIVSFLASFSYPLYFLDYETLSGAVPAFDGIRPYQQVPFQYSLHRVSAPGAVPTHTEYVHRERSLPVDKLVQQLVCDIGSEGSVVAWNKRFEENCNVGLAELVPGERVFLEHLNSRLVDLMVPFAEGWYADRDFLGSASIKSVLPVIVPELSYQDFTIHGGGTAQRLWMQCVLDNKIDSTEEQIMDDLRAYCTLDTFAMVRIWEFLTRLVQKEL